MIFLLSFIAVVLFSSIFSLFVADLVTLIVNIWKQDINSK